MRTAFSLVELSIVLVILGLLTGGILAGQNLIRAAELRSVTTQLQSLQSAIYTFRSKYFSYPGDITNAESFWGTMSTGTCPNATAGTGTQTCNGDGDGVISAPSAAGRSGEKFTFWQHLANAGLIEGSYSGIGGSGSVQHGIAGVNIPRGKISNSAWWASTFDNTSGGSVIDYQQNFGTTIGVGANKTNTMPYDPLFTPEEAWNIDKKVDDGKPAYGKVIAMYFADLCASADDGTSAADDFAASYRVQDGSVQCVLRIKDAY